MVTVMQLLLLVMVVNMTSGIIQKVLLWKPTNEDVEGEEVYSYTYYGVM